MKLFLDTAHIPDIESYAFLIDGVTTNPSNLSKEQQKPLEVVKKICSLLKDKDVSVEVTEKDPDKLYKQAQQIANISRNVVVKVPCHSTYYPIIKKLVQEEIALNITLVFTLTQALYMCKLGVKYISPFIGRWDDIEVDGGEILSDIKGMTEWYGYDTQVLAASIRNLAHVQQAIRAGSDVITMPVAVLKQSMDHILTDQGIEKFEHDWKKLGVGQFP